jgi:hypothetical protein
MSGPFTLRIARPYASREDYLQGDYWTVERSEMLLLDVEGVAQGAQVTFEIILENKEIVVRGEGRALELIPPRDGRPGGVRVRFKQLDAASKATLRRALEIQKKKATERQALPAVVDAPPPAQPEPAKIESKETAPVAEEQAAAKEAQPAQEVAAPAPEAAAPVPAAPVPEVAAPAQIDSEREEPSGVHRIADPVRAPENREALLERLRERTRLRKGVAAPIEKSSAAAE